MTARYNPPEAVAAVMPAGDPDRARARIESLILRAKTDRSNLTPEKIDALCRQYRTALTWEMLDQRAPRLTWRLPDRGAA